MWKLGSRDIRDVLKIAKLCNPVDGEEDITRLYMRNTIELVVTTINVMLPELLILGEIISKT